MVLHLCFWLHLSHIGECSNCSPTLEQISTGVMGDNRTALHLASRGGSLEIVTCLVNKGASLNDKDTYGQTPLMFAAESSHLEIVQLLMNSGVDIHCCDNSGWTALHYSSSKESVETVECFVNKGMSLDIKNVNDVTPLHIAVEANKMEIVHYLLKMGADCNLEHIEGESPFNCLMQKSPNVETIKLCIEKGAYLKLNDYNKLLEDPLLKENILQDVKLCSQAVINKFNNKDLPLLYKELASAQKLPHIDKMKLSSGMALEVEQNVAHEIQANGFCNVFQMIPLVLGVLCVKFFIEKQIPLLNRGNPSEPQTTLKRLRSDDKSKSDDECSNKKMVNTE